MRPSKTPSSSLFISQAQAANKFSQISLGGGSKGETRAPPIFLDQTEAKRTENFLGGPGLPLSKGRADRGGGGGGGGGGGFGLSPPPPPPRLSQGLDPALSLSLH